VDRVLADDESWGQEVQSVVPTFRITAGDISGAGMSLKTEFC
jgi:hypothetical protein